MAASQSPPPAFVLHDDSQREVVFLRSPQRIVAMLPSLTETICALGACNRLVGTDRFSDWPAQVSALPKAGGLDDASIEMIVSLKPDLILVTASQRLTDRLSHLGLQTFVLNPVTYADIRRTIIILGRILDLSERAATLEENLDAAVRDIGDRASLRRHGTVPSVYFEVGGSYAAGPESFIGELLTRLGTRNIVAADLGPFPKLNAEYVVRHDPDVIFVAASAAPGLEQRPGWQTIRAVRERRLCAFAPEVNDTLVRPGPRVAEGMRALADCLERLAP